MTGQTEILIVEDSITQAFALQHTLEEGDFRVIHAKNGREALAILTTVRPSIIISDVVMPEMDGYYFCRLVKANPKTCKIPVLLLTSLSNTGDVFAALQAGADSFVPKPYQPDFLLANVRRILDNLALREGRGTSNGLEVTFAGRHYEINSSREQIVDFLLSTYESALQRNQELIGRNSELQDALHNIKVLQTNYRQLLETNVDAVVVIGQDGVIRYTNPAAADLRIADCCLEPGATLALPLTAGMCQEIELATTTGTPMIAEMRAVETHWDGECTILAVLRDYTEQAHLREELRHLSLRDGLTGLYNRRGFLVLGGQMLMDAAREARQLFITFVDMDRMKWINDNLGHQEGDQALCDIAMLLNTTFRSIDIIGRMGGDEFAVLGAATDDLCPNTLAKRLTEQIEAHNATGQRAYQLAVSVGVESFTPDASTNLDALLESADALMYEQKRQKRAARSDLAGNRC